MTSSITKHVKIAHLYLGFQCVDECWWWCLLGCSHEVLHLLSVIDMSIRAVLIASLATGLLTFGIGHWATDIWSWPLGYRHLVLATGLLTIGADHWATDIWCCLLGYWHLVLATGLLTFGLGHWATDIWGWPLGYWHLVLATGLLTFGAGHWATEIFAGITCDWLHNSVIHTSKKSIISRSLHAPSMPAQPSRTTEYCLSAKSISDVKLVNENKIYQSLSWKPLDITK